MSTQPEALKLADALQRRFPKSGKDAAAELRRLHEVNQELLVALQACADGLQDEIYNSGEDENENPTIKELVRRVKKAHAAIAKAEGEAK